jgi:16S rRNA (adenine1518-N6/adenine1519-N6)-dimethyltransferase
MHARIAERIALVSGVGAGDSVLEIGPGTGMLTRELLKRVQKVIAIEADGELYEQLREDFAQDISDGRLELVHGDIRTFSLATLPGAYTLVANIPYYLTGEIFRMFLAAMHQPRSVTLLVQKEVAERIARSKKESILSLSVKAYGVPRYEFTVPRGAFVPAPKVDSAVLSVTQISRSAFRTPREETRFFDLVHAGFAHKRKRVANNLAPLGITEDRLPKNARAEDLPLSVWLELSHVHR